MDDDLAHQQTPISAEKDARFPLQDLVKVFIAVVIFIEAVKPQHSQIGRQSSQVIVEQKSRLDRASIRDRMQFHLITILADRTQRCLLAVDLYPSDLWMRYSQRLRQML